MSDCMAEEGLTLRVNEPHRMRGDRVSVFAPLFFAVDLRDHMERVVFKNVETGQVYTCPLSQWADKFKLDKRLAAPAPEPKVIKAERAPATLDLRQKDGGH